MYECVYTCRASVLNVYVNCCLHLKILLSLLCHMLVVLSFIPTKHCRALKTTLQGPDRIEASSTGRTRGHSDIVSMATST